MPVLSAPTPIRQLALDADEGYVPGVCNIGPWEIRRRRMFAVTAFVAAVALFAFLVAVGVPTWMRVVVFAPLFGGAVSWLQARRRFCVAYAMGGLSNFGDEESTRQAVVDPVQRALDRRATTRLARDAFLLAIGPAILAVILPI